MRSRTASPASRSPRTLRSSERGYVLLVFAVFAVVLVAGAYKILPAVIFQGQRQKEEILITRGLEYQRAIQLFVRKFGRYPGSLEELENTNQIRFLRQRYPDPMTEGTELGGEWRLIHFANGAFIDSMHSTSAVALPGQETKPTGDESTEQTPAQQGTNANPRPTQQAIAGAGIAGVASQSEAEAIKVWNGYQRHNEWEFVFDFQKDAIAAKKVASLTPQGGQQGQGQQGQQGSQGQGQGQGQRVLPPPFGFGGGAGGSGIGIGGGIGGPGAIGTPPGGIGNQPPPGAAPRR
jgi:type II secretory pathway pseudopilin PulG